MARSTLLLQANRLEEMAATDDLTLLRQAKDDDAAYAAFRQYFLEHLPHMAASESEGGRSKAMLAFLRGDVCERREMLLGIADLLKQLAEQPMDAGTLDAAVECMKRLSPVVRI
jgi:GGDEF domain-containing protein